MKRKTALVVALIAIATGSSMAQVPGTVNLNPQFFFSIIAGVLLALAFQTILTLISTATGITMIGNVEEKYLNRNKSGGNAKAKESDKDKTKDKDDTPMGVKITSAVGIFTVLTASISLFFASWLAVRFSLIADFTFGLTLGLVIWALFMAVITYVEYKSIKSLFGGLMTIASEGFKSAANIINKVLGKSTEDEMTKVATSTVDAISKELSSSFDTGSIVKKLDKYFDKIQPREFDYDKVKNDLSAILRDMQFTTKTEYKDSEILEKTFIKLAQEQPRLSKQQVNKLKGAFTEAKDIAQSDDDASDKLMAAVDKFTPGSDEDSMEIREKIAAYLKSTGKDELTPDRLKKDFETILRDPVSSKDILKKKVKAIDRSAIVNALSQRTDLGRQESDQIAGYVEKAFETVTGLFQKGESKASDFKERMPSDANDSIGALREIPGISEAESLAQNKEEGFISRFEDKLRNYFNSLERDELNYERMKVDFEGILDHPGATLSIIRNRLDSMDRNTVIALISSMDKFSKADAERIVNNIEEAKDKIIIKAEKLETTARKKIEDAKFMALEQAENTRKTASSAAWWMVATFVVSGIASAIGGIIAL